MKHVFKIYVPLIVLGAFSSSYACSTKSLKMAKGLLQFETDRKTIGISTEIHLQFAKSVVHEVEFCLKKETDSYCKAQDEVIKKLSKLLEVSKDAMMGAQLVSHTYSLINIQMNYDRNCEVSAKKQF